MLICLILFCYRQGKYEYKPGTTGVLSEVVKPVKFELVSTETRTVEAMDT